MGLRGRIKKLTQQAEEGAVLMRLRDGSTRVFTVMDVQKEMFLAKCDLARGGQTLPGPRGCESRYAGEPRSL